MKHYPLSFGWFDIISLMQLPINRIILCLFPLDGSNSPNVTMVMFKGSTENLIKIYFIMDTLLPDILFEDMPIVFRHVYINFIAESAIYLF